jgi:hypothetical protein
MQGPTGTRFQKYLLHVLNNLTSPMYYLAIDSFFHSSRESDCHPEKAESRATRATPDQEPAEGTYVFGRHRIGR